MEPDVSFVGIQLLPGKPVAVNDDEESENQIWTLHITQFALADKPRAGRNVVSIIKDDGRKFVLGTLEKNRCEQFQADFMISESVKLVVDGDSEVHLTGYKTTTELLDPEAEELVGDSDDDDEEDEDYENELQRRALAGADGEDDDDESESDEDEEAPQAVPLKRLTPKQEADKLLKQLAAAQAAGAGNSEDEEDVDEEELEEDDEDDEDAAAAAAGLADMDADEDDEDDEEDEEEEEEAPPAKAAKAKRPAAAEAKRPAAGTPAAPSAKKAKTAAQTPGSGDGGGDAQWLKDIRAYVAKEGPTSLSTIGSAVKKPPGTSAKLGKLLKSAPGFEVGADNVVKLKK